jgi:hypothetical protein
VATQIAVGIRAMQIQREIPLALEADRAAAALLAGIQGGVLILMSTGSVTRLEAALDLGVQQLLSSGAGSPRPRQAAMPIEAAVGISPIPGSVTVSVRSTSANSSAPWPPGTTNVSSCTWPLRDLTLDT